jgi:uncharacterized protein
MIYCDTSFVVAALTPEARTTDVQNWMEGLDEGALCVSAWTVTEFSAAISAKARIGAISAELKASALTRWRGMLDDGLSMAKLPEEAFELAARFCEMRDTALRAGDALHLAIASIGGHRLATLDIRMAEAALAVGVEVVDIAK